MLDSFRSLISWSKCLISSLFSTPVWRRRSHFPRLNWKHPHFSYKASCKLNFVYLFIFASASLPLLAFSLIVISSSECFFLILCAFSGHPDKLHVDWREEKKLNMNAEMKEGPRFQANQREGWQNQSEIKGKTMELTFCEWQTHYWHVPGRCSQAGDNGAVPVCWPSRQRAAHWWTTPSVFWQPADNCRRCDGTCIFPICGPVRHSPSPDTWTKSRHERRNIRGGSTRRLAAQNKAPNGRLRH